MNNYSKKCTFHEEYDDLRQLRSNMKLADVPVCYVGPVKSRLSFLSDCGTYKTNVFTPTEVL